MTEKLPYTRLAIERGIRGVEKAGRFVVGVRLSDGTLIVADKPFDAASLAPTDAQPSRPSARRFGEKLGGSQGEA
jgi:hypothetical protein